MKQQRGRRRHGCRSRPAPGLPWRRGVSSGATRCRRTLSTCHDDARDELWGGAQRDGRLCGGRGGARRTGQSHTSRTTTAPCCCGATFHTARRTRDPCSFRARRASAGDPWNSGRPGYWEPPTAVASRSLPLAQAVASLSAQAPRLGSCTAASLGEQAAPPTGAETRAVRDGGAPPRSRCRAP